MRIESSTPLSSTPLPARPTSLPQPPQPAGRSTDLRGYHHEALTRANLLSEAPVMVASNGPAHFPLRFNPLPSAALNAGFPRPASTQQELIQHLGQIHRQDNFHARYYGSCLVTAWSGVAQQNPDVLRLLTLYAQAQPPEWRSEMLGQLYPSPLDHAVRNPRLPMLELAAPPRLELNPRPWTAATAPPPPPPPPDPDVQRFQDALRALQLPASYRVDSSRVRQDLERLLERPAVRSHVESAQRNALLRQAGLQGRPGEARDLARRQSEFLLSPAFQQRLAAEGQASSGVIVQELARLNLLDPEVARTTSLALVGQSGAGRALTDSLNAGSPELRRRAIEAGVEQLPGISSLSSQERSGLVQALNSMSNEERVSALQQGTNFAGRGSEWAALSERTRNLLGRVGGVGSVLTLSGAAYLTLAGDADPVRLTQLGLDGLADAQAFGRYLLRGTAPTAQQAGRLATALRLAGPAAQGVGAFLSGRDAWNAYREGNTASAAAYGGSALFSGAAAGLGVFGLANGWNPAGWISLTLAAGAFGLGLLGGALRDTDQAMLSRYSGWQLPPPPPPVPTLNGR